MMRTSIRTSAVVIVLTTMGATAQAADKEPYAAVRDTAGKVVRDGRGDCVQALSTKRTINADCGGEVAAAPKPPAPPAAVEPAKAAPAPEPVAVQVPNPAPADMTPEVKPAPQSAKAAISIEGSALFAFDQAEIKPEARGKLEEVAEQLKAQPGVDEIVISGHADATGPEEYNQELSKRRAENVRKFLLKEGVVSKRIVIQAHGEEQPIASNDTQAGRAKNRRVEISVLP